MVPAHLVFSKAAFVFANDFENWKVRMKSRFKHRALRRKYRILVQVRNANILSKRHLATVRYILPHQYLHQRAFAGAVFSNQRHLLPLLYSKADALKQNFLPIIF